MMLLVCIAAATDFLDRDLLTLVCMQVSFKRPAPWCACLHRTPAQHNTLSRWALTYPEYTRDQIMMLLVCIAEATDFLDRDPCLHASKLQKTSTAVWSPSQDACHTQGLPSYAFPTNMNLDAPTADQSRARLRPDKHTQNSTSQCHF